MNAVIRVHRGYASPERVFMMESTQLGRLESEVTDFTVPAGHHVFSLKLGHLHSVQTHVELDHGAVLELKAVENPGALLPLAQGGFLRLERVEA